jgi:hypothetical protein
MYYKYPVVLSFTFLLFALISSRDFIDLQRKRYCGASRSLLLSEHLGINTGAVFDSSAPAPLPGAAGDSSAATSGLERFENLRAAVWRTREASSIEGFKRWFNMLPGNARQYPLLAAVIKHEKDLPLIKHIGAILAWHTVLFSVLKPGSISRDEVGNK